MSELYLFCLFVLHIPKTDALYLSTEDDEEDEVMRQLVRTPAKVYASDADHDASVTVVSPPMGL